VIDDQTTKQPAEPVQPGRELGVSPEREPGNTSQVLEADRPPERQEGVVSDVIGAGGTR
jgi:hypothetical protein